MDTSPDLGVLTPESLWDYSTPLHTMIEASEEKRKAMQLAKRINAFPEQEAAYFTGRPIEDQTCSICKNRYQQLRPLPADEAQYHKNNLAITDRSRIRNNNNNPNLQHAYNSAICLPCGHILCKSCTKTWLSINPSCSTCRHPVPLPDIVYPETAINQYRKMGKLVTVKSTLGDLKVFILDSGLERCTPRGGAGLDKGRIQVAKYEVDQWESSLIEVNKWNPT